MAHDYWSARTGESPSAMGRPGASSSFLSSHDISSSGRSVSAYIASAGHSGMQAAQSMHSSGSITRYSSASLKASTGQHGRSLDTYIEHMHWSLRESYDVSSLVIGI